MADKKLNILFLSSWYPNRLQPTLGNFVQKHAEAVTLRSNVTSLFVCSDVNCRKKFEFEISDINNVHSINVYYKKVEHNIPIISQIQKASRYFAAHLKGLTLVDKHFGKIDIVHQNILYPVGIIALFLKIRKHIPYLITEHWTGYLPSKNVHMGIIERSVSKVIARQASFITPVSRDLQNAMISKGFEGNYRIIYNVVDTELFHPQINKVRNNKVKLLHISTLDDPHKNISGMLHVVCELSKQRSDFEIWFVGDGDTEPHIKTAKQLGIYNTFVFFDGTKTTEEVAELMRGSDCFVLFSNYENLPCVMLESFASGVPVISSSVGGIPEHITETNGMLVTAKDEKELLKILNKAIGNIHEGKYNANVLRNYAENNFSYKKVSDNFHELYAQMLRSDV